MKINKKLYSLALVSAALILFLILVSSAASARIIETRITNYGTVYNCDINGNNIAFSDERSGDFDIYVYNLSNKKETRITKSGGAHNPDVYGNRIVYECYRNRSAHIYMYDLSTKKETQIAIGSVANPIIYGNYVLYSVPGDVPHVEVYNISTKKVITILAPAVDPAIYGNKIVYLGGYGIESIGFYDISTKKKTQINTSVRVSHLDIYENKIVWAGEHNEKYDIYMYDLSTKKETKITGHSGGSSPVIFGNNIVWEGGYDGNSDIYAYNIETHQQTHTNDKLNQLAPAISGNNIVWLDFRNIAPDVYMGTLVYSPFASFSASPTSGKIPLNVKFTDKSTGTPKKWKWDFGDGTTSTKQNPIHKYSKVGVYTVKLTVTNAAGSNTTTKTDYVKVVTKPIANFSATPTEGKIPLTVIFTDKSTRIPTKWKWSFGDGTTSTKQNPKHQYLQEGKYTVKLIATNAAGSSTKTKTNYIKVITNTRPGIYSENK